jgi:hypothetical protein
MNQHDCRRALLFLMAGCAFLWAARAEAARTGEAALGKCTAELVKDLFEVPHPPSQFRALVTQLGGDGSEDSQRF